MKTKNSYDNYSNVINNTRSKIFQIINCHSRILSYYQANPPIGRRLVRTYTNEPQDEILELVRRPSYTTRYRTVRNRYPDDVSPTRRTTIVRRAPETMITESNPT